jgi:hypothetical protein
MKGQMETSEMVLGELRGEIKSLIRELQETRMEQIRQYTACQECQSRVQKQAAELATRLSNHLVFHQTKADLAQQIDSQIETAEHDRTAGRRWSIGTILQTTGIILACGLALASLIHNW